MQKRFFIGFTAITPEEWHEFHLACLKNKETMTKVLMRAIRDYIAKGKEGAK